MKPVLFIGLGGTGKQVLMSLRRMMLDQYGAPRLPHTAFLCIDTDTRLVDLDGKAFDEFLMEAQLTGAERIDAPLDNDKLEQFYKQPVRYPQYTSWFDLGLRRHGRIEHGAAQIRAFGRMAFFQHFKAIKDGLSHHLNALRNPSVRDAYSQQFGKTLDQSSVDVYVVFSVAGGTGAGMYLDLAFLLKDIPGAKTNVEAITLLPTAFNSDPSERVYANAYASLLELEYYNYQRAKDLDQDRDEGLFRVLWTEADARAAKPRTLMGPVFQVTWLIDNQSRLLGRDGRPGVSLRPDQKWSLTEMIAEWLFVRYAERADVLAAAVQSDASNFLSHTSHVASMQLLGATDARSTQALSCRYGSFGFSKIYAPVEAMALDSAHRLAGDVIDRWLRRPDMPGSALGDFERERYGDLLLGTGMIDEQILPLRERMLQYDSASRVTDEALGLVRDRSDRVLAEGVDDSFPGELEAFRRDTESRLLAEPNGELTRVVDLNAEQAYKQIMAAIDRILFDALANERYRFLFAGQILEKLERTYRQIADYAQGQVAVWQDEAGRLNSEKDRVANYAPGEQPFVRRTAAKVAFEYVGDSVMSELERKACDRIASLARRVADAIGQGEDVRRADGSTERVTTGLVHKVDRLEDGLRRLRKRIDDRRIAVAGRRSSFLNYRLGSEAGEYYKTNTGAPMDDRAIAASEARVYGSDLFKGDASPWRLADRLDSSGEDLALRQLLLFAGAEMRHVREETTDALRLFDKKFPGGQGEVQYRQQLLTQLSNGSPWISSHKDFADESSWQNNQRFVYRITVDSGRADQDAQFRFRKILDEEMKSDDKRVIDGPPDMLLFEAETVGFPLAAVPRINEYREAAYLPRVTASLDGDEQAPHQRVVHIELDTEKYTDIVPLSVEDVDARLDAIEVLAVGLMTGVIWAKPVGGVTPSSDPFAPAAERPAQGYEFVYRYREQFDEFDRQLGRFDRAVRVLASKGQDWQKLSAAVSKRRDNDLDYEDRAQLLLLLHRLRSGENAPIRGDDWRRALQRASNRLETREPGLVGKARDSFQASLPDWAVEAPAGSGFLRIPRFEP